MKWGWGGVGLFVVQWSVCWGGGSVCTWEVHSGFLGASGTECEQSWPLTQPEQWLELFTCESGWSKGKDFSLAISITESHLPTSIIQSHLDASECVAVGQRCGAGPSESLQLPQPLPQGPNPTFRAEIEAAITGHKFPSHPQCPVWTGTNLCSPAMPAPHKTLPTQNTAERLKMLHS